MAEEVEGEGWEERGHTMTQPKRHGVMFEMYLCTTAECNYSAPKVKR